MHKRYITYFFFFLFSAFALKAEDEIMVTTSFDPPVIVEGETASYVIQLHNTHKKLENAPVKLPEELEWAGSPSISQQRTIIDKKLNESTSVNVPIMSTSTGSHTIKSWIATIDGATYESTESTLEVVASEKEKQDRLEKLNYKPKEKLFLSNLRAGSSLDDFFEQMDMPPLPKAIKGIKEEVPFQPSISWSYYPYSVKKGHTIQIQICITYDKNELWDEQPAKIEFKTSSGLKIIKQKLINDDENQSVYRIVVKATKKGNQYIEARAKFKLPKDKQEEGYKPYYKETISRKRSIEVIQ